MKKHLICAMLCFIGIPSSMFADEDITASKIVNNDFETTTNMVEASSATSRGVPTSWKVWGKKGNTTYTQEPGSVNTTLLPGQSYGANGGCASTRHSDRSCWFNCSPMPDDFKLYQEVELEEGTYIISCLLSPMTTGDDNLTNLRLFAGDNACYFGTSDKYDQNLGSETNKKFMGLTTTMDGNDPKLQEVSMLFTLTATTTIEIGIRTSNMKKDGTRVTDSNNGRFRVDYFRLFKHVHAYNSNGICSGESCPDKYQPATQNAEDNYYELANAGNVEWLSAKVAENGNTNIYNAKLTSDIDFENIENLHSPIGPTTGKKYKGTFDGQGHRIKNLKINRPDQEAQGFFGWLQGNSTVTIKNLIVDGTIIGSNKCGGIAGASQNQGGLITIENVVNEVDVTVSGQDAAGIVGGESGDKATYKILNVVNKGNITSTHQYPYAGALFCYQEHGTVENFINLGTITGHDGGNIGRFNGTKTNIVDLSNTENKTQFVVAELTTADIASGKLAYYMNQHAGSNVFFQTLGGDNPDAYPMPFSTHGIVYANGTFTCDGTPKTVEYSNTDSGQSYDPHNNVQDICTVCGYTSATITKDEDDYYNIGNAGQLAKFAKVVNDGETGAKGKLTANIDASVAPYTVIGTEANKFNGTFDGNGHKVKLNIDANAYGQGFISIATGGTTVKNLVVTGKVKNAGSKTAGIIAEAIGGGTITIQNCGNEATIEGAGGEVAAIVANNWGYQCTLNLENVYNIGDVSGTGDVSTICACQGNSSSVFKNVYNSGSVTGATQGNFVRPSNSGYGTYTNCYSTTLSNDNASIISTNASAVASGELCAKLGFGFRQNLSSDTYPNLASGHGFVVQIGDAGYSTMYNVYSDVEIPSGIEAYAGVVNGESLSLVAIENKIAASEPVVLKLAEGTDAGLFNFMPTTGASKAASNNLKGSDGNVDGGTNIYALAKLTPEGESDPVVGFYPTGNYKIPEGKAYLEITGSSVKGFTFVFDDDATGIEETLSNSPLKGENIYNVAGQRINKMQKGINIVNGKKVMVK